MQTIWISPEEYISGDSSLAISYAHTGHPGTIVKSNQQGDLFWISMALRLPEQAKIEEVVVNYQVSNPRSFISQVRLAQINTPDQALVIHDDGTDLKSVNPVAYTSHVGQVLNPLAAVTLELRLNFQDTNDEIRLGAVGVKISQVNQCCGCTKTIADLRALPAGSSPCHKVLGYHAPGDGGGGDFYWDASSTEADDSGTVFIPASNPPIGRWKRLFDNGVSVKWFGAKGDGVNADRGAIQNAINYWALSGRDGGQVFLPPGFYIVDDTPGLQGPPGLWFGLSVGQNIKLVGAGNRVSIIEYSGQGTAIAGGRTTLGAYKHGLQINSLEVRLKEPHSTGITLNSCWGAELRRLFIQPSEGTDNKNKTGVRINNTILTSLVDVKSHVLQQGFVLEGTGVTSINFFNCAALAGGNPPIAGSVGLEVNSGNGNGSVWIGGNFESLETAIKLHESAGPISMIGARFEGNDNDIESNSYGSSFMACTTLKRAIYSSGAGYPYNNASLNF